MKAQHSTHAYPPYIEREGIYAVPSLHGNLRFAGLVRQAFFALQPDALAVELPGTLSDLIEDGVGRLPYISVLAYEDFDEEMQNVRQILPITPGDSLLEAIRLGKSLGVPVHYVDRDVLAYQAQPVRAPDDYLIERIGLEGYWDRFKAQRPPADPGSPDDLREIEMAAHLRELRGRHERVLFVCGMAHLQAVLGHMS
ncbi:MAG: hypothetical protein O7E56_14520, partial [SAR324 cluster bacterium]|nr:hypothetical protein [SAR324 cluster bacterium]